MVARSASVARDMPLPRPCPRNAAVDWYAKRVYWSAVRSVLAAIVVLLGATARAQPAPPPAALTPTEAPAPLPHAAAADVPLFGQPTPTAAAAREPSEEEAAEAEQAERLCVGKRLVDLVLEGCKGTRCEDPASYQQVLSLTDLAPGDGIRPGTLVTAQRRVAKLGWFARAGLRCLPDLRGQARVAIAVQGNLFVRRVDFKGNDALFTDELRQKLVVRPGDVLDPATPTGQNALDRQREAIFALYQRNGYDHAKVQVSAQPAGPGEVNVVVQIDEGGRQRVTDLEVRIQAPPPPSDAEEAAGLVCPHVSDKDVRDASQLETVEVFSRRLGNMARNEIQRLLRRKGYGEPRIDVSVAPGEKTVRLDVRPGRCALVRVFQREEGDVASKSGYLRNDDQKLLDVLPSTETGLYDFDEADRGRVELTHVFENRGFPFVRVAMEHRPVPKVLASQVGAVVTYWVTTGYQAQVRGLTFPGVSDEEAAVLRGVVSSKAYDVLGQGGYTSPDALLADLDAIANHYRVAGYNEHRFPLGLPEDATRSETARTRIDHDGGAVTFEYRWPGRGFRIRKPAGEHFLYVEVPVVKGEPSRLRRVRVEGGRTVGEPQVRDLLGLDSGDVISFARLAEALQRVDDHYRNSGFFRVKIVATCATETPMRDEAPCSATQLLARTVDLRVRIEEGERVQFGESFASGNFNTDTRIVLRDLPEPGDPYSADALFEAQRRVRDLGLFSQVSLRHIGDDEVPPRQRLATVVQVVEGPAKWREASFGFQTVNARPNEAPSLRSLVRLVDQVTASSDRLAGGLGERSNLDLPNLLLTTEFAYSNLNFLRRAWELRLPVKLGATFFEPCDPSLAIGQEGACERQATLSAPDSAWQQTYERYLRVATFVPSYVNRRLFDSDWGLRLTVPYFMHDYAVSAVDVDQTGMLTEVSRRFDRLSLVIGTDVGLIRTRDAQAGETEFSEFAPKFRAEPALVWDGTDSPINPHKGMYWSVRPTYINAAAKDQATQRYVRANFLKTEVVWKGYSPIGSTLTLAGNVRVGHAFLLGDDENLDLPDNERYRLGSDRGLRGYPNDGVRQYYGDGRTRHTTTLVEHVETDPKTKQSVTVVGFENRAIGFGNAVVNGSAELRFPLAREYSLLGATFWGAVFWDFGALGDGLQHIHRNAFRHGVGAGVRAVVAGQIPFRLDYGIALGERCREVDALPVAEVGVDKPGCRQRDEFGAATVALLYSF
jgi:outer membrane protein assembly factor BamA